MNFETPDRIPVTVGLNTIWSDWYFRRRYGIKIGEYWRDPRLSVEYQLRGWIDSFRDFEDDRPYVIPPDVGPLGGVVLHPTIAGCRAVFPEDDFAWIDLGYRALDTEEKIDDYQVPEVAEAGLMPETLERFEEIEDLAGDLLQVRIQGGNGGPLQMAAYTRGIRELIRDMHTNPDLVHKLMGKMVGVYRAIKVYYRDSWGIRYRGADIDGYFYDNPLSYFSPRLVEEFVLPYYEEFARECSFRTWSMETQDVLDPFLEIYKSIPIGKLRNLVSNSDLVAFRKELEGVCFNVYIAPGRLLHGPSIEPLVDRVVEAMGLGGGWTLSSGVLDAAVPEENIHAFLKAGKSIGFIGK